MMTSSPCWIVPRERPIPGLYRVPSERRIAPSGAPPPRSRLTSAVSGLEVLALMTRGATRIPTKKRVVIAGLGDTGLLVALDLHPGARRHRHHAQAGAGQRTGARHPARAPRCLAQAFPHGLPALPPPRRHADRPRADHGRRPRAVASSTCAPSTASRATCAYDVLVIASGVTNGFWRDARLEDMESVNRRIDRDAEQLAAARSVAVLGGGATGVSSASNLKERYPGDRRASLLQRGRAAPELPPERPARGRRRASVEQGVVLHANHRAALPPDFSGERLTTDAIRWETGQAPFQADVTLWAVGRARPNTGFLPSALLDADAVT